MEQTQKPMPRMGVGPLYAPTVMLISILAWYFDHEGLLPRFSIPALAWPLRILGGLMGLGAFVLWARAAFFSQLQTALNEEKLLTTGPFAIVRNPIYAAFMIGASAIIIYMGNLYLFVLPMLYYAFLAILLRQTEEKWLRARFGQEFDDYCRRVNRCIPWFPRK